MKPLSPKIQQQLNQAQQLYQAGRTKQAINICGEVVKNKPKCYQAHYLAGQIFLNDKMYDSAVVAFRKVVEINSKHASAWAHLAFIYYPSGFYDDYQKAIQQAIKYQSAETPIAQHLIGFTLNREGLPKEADKWYSKALKNDPHNITFKRDHSLVLTYLGELERAEKIMKDLIKNKHYLVEAHWGMSFIKKATDHSHIDQIQALKKKVDPQDSNALAHLNYAIGKEFEDLKEWDNAFTAFSEGAAFQRASNRYDEESALKSLDILAEYYTPAWLESQQGYDDASPIFIIGQPRTGTTLIERIITAHSAISSAGELEYMPNSIRQHVTQKPQGNTTNHQSGLFSLSEEFLIQAHKIDMQAIGKLYINRCRRVRGKTPHFVDKMPMNFALLPFILAALPNAKIIHLQRNPRDTCFAVFKQLFGSDYYQYSYDLEEMARYYIRYNQLMNFWKEQFPGRFHNISYEDTIYNPDENIRDLFHYLKLPWEEKVLNFHEQESAVSTASAIQVRQPLHTGSIGRWKNYEKHLGSMLKILDDHSL